MSDRLAEMRNRRPGRSTAAGNALQVLGVHAIDALVLLDQVPRPRARVRVPLLIAGADDTAHRQGSRRRAAFPGAALIDAGLPVLAEEGPGILAFLPLLADHPCFKEQVDGSGFTTCGPLEGVGRRRADHNNTPTVISIKRCDIDMLFLPILSRSKSTTL